MITYRRHYTEKKALNFILKWFVDLVFVICLSLMISTFAFSKITMVGHSMENVIVNGDKMFIDKISYKIGNPKRFDIIVFTTDNDNSDTKLIKRVIGLPGEKIYIDSGKIYINGKELKDDVVHDIIYNAGIASKEFTLGNDEYFVLGDNRNNSEDSRQESIGLINRNNIEGKVWIIYYPIKRIEFIK